jgi:dethiobiotin synthetase
MRSVLVTGTDTSIGKTHVVGIIARLLAKQGRVQVVKPVESGYGVDMAHNLSSGQFDSVAVFSSRFAFRLSAMD